MKFRIYFLVASVMLGAVAARGDREVVATVETNLLNFALPAPESGRLVSVRALGPNRPLEPRIAVVTYGSEKPQSVLPVQHPRFARWRTPGELLLHASIRPVREGSGNCVFRFGLNHGELGDLADRNGLGIPFPSPDGNLVALARSGFKPGEKGLEIFPLVDAPNGGFRLGDPRVFRDALPFHLAWRPDSLQLAVSVHETTPRGRLWPRLHVIDIASGEMRRIADAVPPRTRELGGTTPLFWTEHGLYASSQRGVLRCDPSGAGCTSVYDPGERWRVRGGTHVGSGKAYVLLSDQQRDPLETRANELHEVDLVNGGGKRILVTPENTFLEDIDWIAD